MKKMFVMGDSISIHYRGYLANMLRGKISFEVNQKELAYAEIDLDNPMGANAGDSGMVLQKIREYRDAGLMDFDWMLLNCGLHDIKRDRQTGAFQVPIEQYRRNLREILSLIDGAPQRLIWVRTTPVDDERHNAIAKFNRYEKDVAAYNGAADEIMRAAGVRSIDLHSFVKNLPGEIYCDHVHYTEPVRALQAAFISGHCYSYLQAAG